MTSCTEHLPHLVTLENVCAELATAEDDRFTVDNVHEALHQLWKVHESDDELRALTIAFGYYMDNAKGYRSKLVDAEDGQPLSEGPFGPMFEMSNRDTSDGTAFPGALRRQDTAILEVWVKYAMEPTLHPLLRARLADLLWVRKHKQHHRWHEIAVESYLALVDHPEVEVLERECAAIRAVNIARESNQDNLERSAWDALTRLVAMILDEDGESYGPVARCLGHMTTHGHPCDTFLDSAITKHRDDPHRHMQLWQLKAQAASSKTERERCITEAVNTLIADANSDPGLRQLSLLRRAWALAEAEGLRELQIGLEAQIARVDVEGDLTTHKSSFEVSHDDIEAMLVEVIGDAGTLDEALSYFGRRIPIQSVERNQEEAISYMERFPLQHLFGRINIDTVEDQIAVTALPSSEQPEYLEIQVRGIEAQQIDFFSAIVGCNFLRKIDELYSPTLDALVEHFQCAWITEDLARRVARSYLHWQQGDQDSSVSVIVLTIEAVIRSLAQALGITITHIKAAGDGQRVGEAIALGRLLASLDQHPDFEESTIIVRYLDSALTNRWSYNLRNRIAHSLTGLTEVQYAALFHIVCLLRSLAASSQQADDHAS